MDIQGQGSLFLCCLLLGGGMGLVYDGMRLARRILPHGVWAVQIEDGLYWAAVAPVSYTHLTLPTIRLV